MSAQGLIATAKATVAEGKGLLPWMRAPPPVTSVLKKQGFLKLKKTHCIEFGRFAREDTQKRGGKPKDFTFPGSMHYCGKTKEGYFKVKRRTSPKKLGQSLRKFTDWARKVRPVLKKGEMLRQCAVSLTLPKRSHLRMDTT